MAFGGFSVVGDYKVIKTGPVRLKLGGDKDRTFEFDLPKAIDTPFAPEHMIVTFLLVSSNDLHMTIDIDGSVVSDRQYTNGPERCIQEIAANIPVAPLRKAMTFTALRGAAYFSDVVIWFQRLSTSRGVTRGIVADYKAINIGPVRLRVGADTDRTFEFDLPEAIEAARGLPMIVTFFLISSNDLHMTIDIDGTVVSDRQYTNGPERCIQEIAANIPVAPLRKAMTFTVLRGAAYFSDVVIWFQRAADFDDVVIGGL